jgi:hypothetical protein
MFVRQRQPVSSVGHNIESSSGERKSSLTQSRAQMESLHEQHVTLPQSSWICPSCGSTAATLYCGNCGERRIADPSAIAGDPSAIEPQRSFRSRLRASLRALASPPGKLTADWIRGRRVGFVAPLSLFLWVNVAFFLVQSMSGLGILTWPLQVHLSDDSLGWVAEWLLAHHRPNASSPTGPYADIFNALESVHAKSLVIVMVPAFAAVLGVLVIDRRERFKDSLIFAMHFFAFTLIWLCALFPMAALTLRLMAAGGLATSHRSLDLAVTTLEVAAIAWYLCVALGTVFALSRLRRLITAIVLVAALHVILVSYHLVVFAVTLYST